MPRAEAADFPELFRDEELLVELDRSLFERRLDEVLLDLAVLDNREDWPCEDCGSRAARASDCRPLPAFELRFSRVLAD